MSTRYKSNSRLNYGELPLPTGYENKSGASDLFIPSCGVEDVDTAMFRLFEKEIVPEYGGIAGAPLSKVPIIFAAGEKWALLKRGRPIRDRNNTLLLPLITIMRTELNQSMSDDVAGRGINQQVGEIVVKRRLDKSDRDYQSIVNRLFLKNQENLAVRPTDPTVSGQVVTESAVGSIAESSDALAGAYLAQNRINNVYETIVVPMPQFYTVKYQVTVWTQYTQHANQIMEKIFSSFLPQGQSWRLDTDKGYWFVAKLEEGSLAIETNFDDMSAQERFIKHTFDVAVPAYFFSLTSPGAPVPLKRYISSAKIDFSTQVDALETEASPSYQYELGSDDPTLPLDVSQNNRIDQRSIGWRLQKTVNYPVRPLQNSSFPLEDPALSTVPRGTSYVKVASKTSKGETAYTGLSLGGISILFGKKD